MRSRALMLTVLVTLWAARDAAGAALGGPLEQYGVEEIVFAARVSGRDHYYVNFGYYVNNPSRKGYRDGGRLCRLNLRTGKLRVLLDDPKGGVRDPQMHYDGGKILFSYRKGGQPYYHLYEINVDGSGLRQLTDGPFDDVEPCYLPDGGLMFGSSRCDRWVACWYTQVVILYRCDADGGNVRMVSSSIVHDNTPWVLPDGRVLYTRWEYVDRSRVRYHHLWTVNPDGTGQMTYYGNLNGGTVMIDAKPIPGTRKVVASFSPGHGRPEHMGRITVIDPNAGPDARPFARTIRHRGNLRDPYPLSEEHFLVAAGKNILLLDAQGHTRTLYQLPAADRHLECHEPRPLRPRPRERAIRPRVTLSQDTGQLILTDVTYGRNMAGVKRGEIKRLLVLEQLSKPANFSGTMEPTSLGGTFTLKRILGTVPVEPDGSASFTVPALRSLFFVALDDHDLSVKRMQSFVTVQPGEVTSCAGCHEDRFRTPPPTAELMALTRPPSRIQPVDGVPDVLDFPRDVQPILDRHCVVCHNPQRRKDGVLLTGEYGPWYSHAYATLMTRGQVSHGRDADGNRPPRAIGSSASRLMQRLDGGHHKARLSARERQVVRLWIETGAVYAGTYAALGTGMVRPALPEAQFVPRCGACHKARGRRVAFRTHRELLVNLTRPARSQLLLAPLAADAGGYGVCKDKEGDPGGFASTSDALYQKTLAAIRRSADQLARIKRFDMSDFRPNVHYVREMKRYGVLPPSHGPQDPVDVYAADQAYWRRFWYRPPGRRAAP